MRRGGRATRGVDLGHDRRGRCRRDRPLGDRRDDRHVIELLQRARSPAGLRRPSGEHDHRRTVHPRRGHRADAVGHARARGDRGAAEATGDLRPTFGRERRRLLVAGVDQSQARLHRAVVENEQVPARQREHRVDSVLPQYFDRETTTVSFHARLPRGRGQRAQETRRARRSTPRGSRIAVSVRHPGSRRAARRESLRPSGRTRPRTACPARRRARATATRNEAAIAGRSLSWYASSRTSVAHMISDMHAHLRASNSV